MKKMTCEQMGGPCPAEITGNTPEELAANGGKHLHEVHPEEAAKMDAMPDEAKAKWMEDLKKKWDETPEA